MYALCNIYYVLRICNCLNVFDTPLCCCGVVEMFCMLPMFLLLSVVCCLLFVFVLYVLFENHKMLVHLGHVNVSM